MLSYIELSFQAPSYDHNLFTRVYTLAVGYKDPHFLSFSAVVQDTGQQFFLLMGNQIT